jgi:hypothetical protein
MSILGLLIVVLASPAPPKPCAGPEHRQFDFWVGEWDLKVRARSAPDKDEWGEATATQKIESILGGCSIAEHFAADGPGVPWAGKSYSSWQPGLKKWRQTWVDDQGSYIALTGGIEDGVMTLYGEPRTRDGKTVLMRMVFLDVKKDSLRWEWQRQADGKTWQPMMIIEYRRRR